MSITTLCLAQDADADSLLSSDPFALLTGMLLDQQFPMERAFAGPFLLADRLGTPHSLHPKLILATDEGELERLAVGPPAIHRYPAAMARRIAALAAVVVAEYDGEAARIWLEADSGAECLRRLRALPGFGDQKSRIFLALVGKRLSVHPDGWQQACAPYGEPGTFLSVADVVDRESLDRVRAFKKEKKAAARG